MFVSRTMKSVCRTMGQRTIDTNRCTRTPRPVRFFDAYSAGQKFLLPVNVHVLRVKVISTIIYYSKLVII